MKIKVHLYMLCLVVCYALLGQINYFQGTFEEAQGMATKKEKGIAIYTYTSDCEPCELFEFYTLSNQEVINELESNYIIVPMQMDSYPGLALVEELEITFYPSLLFWDNNEIIHRACGAIEAGELLKILQKAKSPSNLQQMQKRFEEGNRQITFLRDYLELLDYSCLDAVKTLNKILSESIKEQLMLPIWEIFATYQWDIYSPSFQYVLENRQFLEDSDG